MLRLLLLTVLSAGQGSAATPDYYTAALVELATPHRPFPLTPDQALVANAEIYLEYIHNASFSQVDIIVFPEGGLTGRHNEGAAIALPSAADNATPCYGYTFHQALRILSCEAIRNKIYVVVSLTEAFDNKNANRTEIYTTTVVFNRKGTVVARYRKYHPYGKTADQPPLELRYFETDFGVKFGMFISFDIQFLEPGIVLARDFGIKHFVFPHCWISALPFFTAVQTQWAWAYALDVALLASGCNDPASGSTGSGVYLGRGGALVYTQTSDVTSRMLVAKLPKALADHTAARDAGPGHVIAPPQPPVSNPQQTSGGQQSLFLLRDYVDVYETRPLMSTEQVESLVAPSMRLNSSVAAIRLTTETSLCQNHLCCNFQVTILNTFNTSPNASRRADDFSRLHYRLATFDGVRSYGGGVATGGVQLCGIIPCVNESLSSCALPADHSSARIPALGPLLKASTVFEDVQISASFLYNSTFIYPDILVSGVDRQLGEFGALVTSDSFTFTTTTPSNGSVTATLKLKTPVPNLVTAAIYARQFNRDGQPRTELSNRSKAQSPQHTVVVLLVCFLGFINKSLI